MSQKSVRIQKSEIPDVLIVPTYTHMDTIQVDCKGQLVQQSVLKEFDFTKPYARFTRNDFALENVLALGNPSLLKEVHLNSMNVDDVVSAFDNFNKSQNVEAIQTQTDKVG